MKVMNNLCINCKNKDKKIIFVIKDNEIETTKLCICEDCKKINR